MNTNHSKLKADIQHIRDLHNCGFRTSTIALAYSVCVKAIADILKGHSWSFVPDVPTELPMLSIDQAMILRVRKIEHVDDPQLQQYADRLANHHHVPVPLMLLSWTRKHDGTTDANVACVETTDRGTAGG